jgi:hypothetical protein
MAEINYALEINTGVTGSTDADIGLTTDGYIRLITGRPDYDGTPIYPTWEDDSNNTEVWYEGILLENSFSSANRRIDIESGGNYGTISGFTFKIQNAMKFWKALEDVSISILNANIQVYCVIDNKFWYAWSGIIDNDPYEETKTLIKCSSNYRKAHKTFPPNQISPNLYPLAKKSSYGSTIPVCFGNIPYVKLHNVSGRNTSIVADYGSGKYHLGSPGIREEDKVYKVAFYEYVAYSRIDIITMRKTYESGELNGKYLRVVSGDNAETDRLLQITSNNASTLHTTGNAIHPTNYRTRCYIASSYDTPQSTVNNYAYDWNSSKAGVGDTWWLEILDAKSRHIVSNQEIDAFKTDDFNQPYMFNYDNETEEMIDAHGLITDLSFRNGRDSVELLQTDINKDGTITYMVPHGAKGDIVDSGDNVYYYADSANLYDMNRETEMDLIPLVTYNLTTSHTPTNSFTGTNAYFNINLLNFDLRDAADIFIGMDLDIIVDPAASGSYDVGVGFEYVLIDNYERTHTITDMIGVNYTYEQSTNSYPFTDQIRYNFLPTEYYKNGTIGLGGTTSIFGEADADSNAVRDYMRFPDDLTDMLKNGTARAIQVRLKFSTTANTTLDSILIRQIGVFSHQETKTGNNSLFMRVSGGEKINIAGDPTDSIYSTVYHILESYDGIPQANIDYGNLADTRNKSVGWEIGRQVISQKNSLDYLKELCQFGFVGMFQKRNGDLKATAFRENQISPTAFTDSNILRNSIKNFRKTSLMKCYNEYKLYWGYNPGSKKFDKSIGITNVDQSAFPDYLTATDGAATEITSPNLVSINFYGDGSGKIEFDADVSGILSAGDYVSYYVHYGDSGIESADHVYFAYITSVDTTDVLYTDPLIYSKSSISGEITYATVYKNAGGTPLWMTYVEGLHSYGSSKKLWEKCNYAYTKTKVVKSAPDNLMKSHWFIDHATYYNLGSSVVSTLSAPYMYLENLIEWSTLPKNQVNISIPVSSTNIQRDLLDYISFTDPILTDNTTLYGWITKISLDMNKSIIDLELTLASTYAANMPHTGDDGGVIIETGDASDTVTETGSQSDTITET